MNLKNVLKKPVVTEKSTQQTALGRYTFLVAKQATKGQIAKAVADYFKVDVKRVWTKVIKDQKRAIVQLAEGQKIDIFESGEKS
jgi:large subunit ribosomal protein L23